MATKNRPHVALFFMGGALLDERNRRGDSVRTPKDVPRWLDQMGEIEMIASVDGYFITDRVDTNGIADWGRLADKVKELYDRYDGFVAFHSPETLSAAGTAMSLMLQQLGKPLVLAGSPLLQVGPHSRDHGAKACFINAVQVATSDVAEVVTVVGSSLYRARTLVWDPGQPGQFTGDLIGKIDFGIRVFAHHQHRHGKKLQVRSKFEQRLAVIEFFPGLSPQAFTDLMKAMRGVFVTIPSDAGAAGTFVSELLNIAGPQQPVFLLAAHTKPANWPRRVFVFSETSKTSAMLEAMWALGQAKTVKDIGTYLPHLSKGGRR